MTPDQQLAIVSIAEMYDAFVADWRMSTDPAWWDDMWVLVVSEFPESRNEFAAKNLKRTKGWLLPTTRPAEQRPGGDRERLGEVLRELVLHSVHGITGASPAVGQQIPEVIPPDITGAMQRHYARGNALVQFLYSLPEYFQQYWQLKEASWQGAHYVSLQQNTSTWLLASEWSALHSLNTWGEEPDELELVGSLSWGTLRVEDLFDTFFDVYIRLPTTTPIDAAQIVEDWVKAERAQDRREQLSEIVDQLGDALSEAAPPGHYFGPHPSDGSDIGFWEFEEYDV